MYQKIQWHYSRKPVTASSVYVRRAKQTTNNWNVRVLTFVYLTLFKFRLIQIFAPFNFRPFNFRPPCTVGSLHLIFAPFERKLKAGEI